MCGGTNDYRHRFVTVTALKSQPNHVQIASVNGALQNRQNEFKNEYPEHVEIADNSIQWLMEKFESSGTLRDLPGRGRKFKRSDEIKDEVRRLLEAMRSYLIESSARYTNQRVTSLVSKFFLYDFGVVTCSHFETPCI